MPDKALFKIICMSSLIFGAILGIIPIIPAFTGLAYIFVMLLSAPFVIIYLFKLNLIKEPETQHCLSIGAITGFFSFLGFSLLYFPIAVVLYLIFKINTFMWIKVLFTNIGFLLPMIILIALLCAFFNMFSAFITVYLYNYFKQQRG